MKSECSIRRSANFDSQCLVLNIHPQRQRTMNEFRTMSIKPYGVNALRRGVWTEVQSDELLPGDLVSIGKLYLLDAEQWP